MDIPKLKNLFDRRSENSQIFFNSLSSVISMGFGFITMPLFTRMLGTEQYGLYSVYAGWLSIFACFMGLGCGQGIGVGRHRFREDYYAFRSSVLLGSVAVSAGLLAGVVLLHGPVEAWLGYPLWLVLVLFAEALAHYLIRLSGSVWSYEKRADLNMLVSAGLLAGGMGLSVLLLVLWQPAWGPRYLARVAGTAIPYVAVAAFVWVYLFRQKPTGYRREYWAYSFQFGLPLIFHNLAGSILSQSDRVMMEQLGTPAGEIGIYSFFYGFAGIMTTILSALNHSWTPFLHEDLRERAYEKLNRRIENYVQVFTVLACGFLLLAREVLHWYAAEDFLPGLPLLPPLVLVVYVNYLYQFSVNYEIFYAETKLIALGTGSAGALNVVLNALMIPRWGMYGATAATLLSYAAQAAAHALTVRLWKNHERYPLSSRPLVLGTAAVLLACAAYYALAGLWPLRWAVGAALGLWLLATVWKRKTIF